MFIEEWIDLLLWWTNKFSTKTYPLFKFNYTKQQVTFHSTC